MDLLDSIDKLLPLLFLFIWVIVGLAAKGKKRTKPAGGPPSSTRRSAGAPLAPKPQRSSGGMGELKKTLQKVFEEIQSAAAEPEMEAIPLEQRKVLEPGRKAAMPESAVEGESEESLETTARRKPQPVSSPPATKKSRQPIPLATVRQGIIWSEILAPPRGMRSIR